ncbi:restriction endonuclease subunit S [Pseudomonas subflava]|uniref:restriction endonuclease subunit S n=1 Tax=Pseudomonas subflava TaxID=2952933 RepID=UPI00207A708D|nr:restriction endonuclease subunit S [Pseudomonas subflava]
MTALLTDNLPLLAGAPNGIKKLRELILELAVRGKLVPQDPSDEPASELLKRIAEEKARLVAEGKIKKQKPLTEIGEEEKPFDVPTNWEWVRVAAVGHDWGQKTPDKAFTYIDVGAVDNAAGMISAPQVLMAEDAPSRARKVVRPGTVIYSTIRPYLLNVAVIEEAYEQEPIASTAFAIIHPYLEMPARYFLSYLRSPVFVRYVESVQMGIAYPAINDGQFFSGLLPLPPLAEQHRIVAKVDELMALCDRLEARQADADSAHAQLVQALLDSLTQATDAADFAASWKRLAEHFHTLFTTESSIDALKQTLLQLAVMGKLVPQDPSDEPANELLKRIAEEKARLISEEGLRTTARDDVPEAEHYFRLHTGWASCRLGNLARFIDYRGRTPTKTSSGVPLITAKNVRPGFISRDPQEFIADSDYLSWMTRGFPRVGDMLFTTEAPMGNVAIIDIAERFALAQRVICFQLHELETGPFLKLTMMSSGFQAQLSDAATGMTATGIKSSRLKEIPVPIPPLAEQHRIVAKIDQLMALCDQLKARLNQACQVHEHLANALVENALSDNRQPAPASTDRKTARTLLAAEITHHLHGLKTFGQRKLQKVFYLAEHAAKITDIQGNYLRDAAGPHDRQLMDQVEGELHNRQWYERIERDTVGHAYRPLPSAGKHRPEYEHIWPATERATIQQVINLMRGWDTDRCERVVTLYAAWNDFLLEGKVVTDEMLVHEVMYSWNDTKLRFTEGEWRAELAEMKKHELLIPSGFGKRTQGGMATLPGLH